MSHRSWRSDDRDWSHSSSHSSHKYYKYEKHEKHEHRHRRDDSRDHSDYYYSRDRPRSDKKKHRSRSRSPSHSSKSHSRHYRSRSRSPGHSSRYYDDSYSRSHRTKDYKERSDSKSRRDSREHSETKHSQSSSSKTDGHTYSKHSTSKYDTSNDTNERGPSTSSHKYDKHAESNNDMYGYDEPKPYPTILSDHDAELEAEKQRIQKETLERLQKHLEKEGKAYPPPKPQASHPIFANDGSFLEMFKSMQGNLQQQQSTAVELKPKPVIPAASIAKPPTVLLPVKRHGAKILKTGIVQKQRTVEEVEEPQPSDSWNAYLKEVKR